MTKAAVPQPEDSVTDAVSTQPRPTIASPSERAEDDIRRSDAPEEDPYAQCPSGLLLGAIVDYNISPTANGMYELLVNGVVQNASDGEIVLGANDVPDVVGYDERGDVTTIELFGRWSNNPRADFTLAAGATLKYSTTARVFADNLRRTVALYSAPEAGSIVALFNEDVVSDGVGWLSCPGPLPPAGSGADVPFEWKG